MVGKVAFLRNSWMTKALRFKCVIRGTQGGLSKYVVYYSKCQGTTGKFEGAPWKTLRGLGPCREKLAVKKKLQEFIYRLCRIKAQA